MRQRRTMRRSEARVLLTIALVQFVCAQIAVATWAPEIWASTAATVVEVEESAVRILSFSRAVVASDWHGTTNFM